MSVSQDFYFVHTAFPFFSQAYQDSEVDFMEKLRGKNLSDEDFKRLLNEHLEETERIRKQRQTENDKLKEKLQKKLKDRKKTDEGEAEEEEEETQEDAISEETQQVGRKVGG